VVGSLKDNIARYKGGETDGEELRTTVAVEKYFNDTDKLAKAEVLAEIDSSLNMLLAIDPRMQELDHLEEAILNG
jgi:hypothetical protein